MEQSVAGLTQETEVPGLIPGPAISLIFLSADSRRAVVSYWREDVHLVMRSCSAEEVQVCPGIVWFCLLTVLPWT